MDKKMKFFVSLQQNLRGMKRYCFLLLLSVVLFACKDKEGDVEALNENNAVTVSESVDSISESEARMGAMGLVDIHDLDPDFAVQMIYAQPHNFMGKTLYKDVKKAFMLPELAEKVVAADRELRKIRPDVHLIIYDAARPISVQQEMWNMVKGTDMDYYVSNPIKRNGLHNFGAAVDVTIVDCTGHPLPMGSEYDYFGEEANTDHEEDLLARNRITLREFENRRLLRKVMTDQGLLTIKSEWWHFNLVTADVARQKYKVIQ